MIGPEICTPSTRIINAAVLTLSLVVVGLCQAPAAKVELGSRTAKAGFRNESDIATKFNDWRNDSDAAKWLLAMGYDLKSLISVTARKPHGEKADVEVVVETASGEKVEGISIKLVSGTQGFNQIDKRWLAQYVKMWRMPRDVEAALKYFVGEMPPYKTSRAPNRMFLNELDSRSQKAVVNFFASNKVAIVSDLLAGDGEHTAGWMMVALRDSGPTRWRLRRIDHVIKYYSEGEVAITRNGNLRIGRITMQRKGGDGGRETAKMLQFKIDPALLFEAK